MPVFAAGAGVLGLLGAGAGAADCVCAGAGAALEVVELFGVFLVVFFLVAAGAGAAGAGAAGAGAADCCAAADGYGKFSIFSAARRVYEPYCHH